MARWQFVRQLEIDGVSYGLFRRDDALSRREAEALALLGRGMTNKEIAFEMGISASTVSVLLYRAATRLGTSSRAELRAAALTLRLAEGAAGDESSSP